MKYGCIGYPLTHSYSREIHAAIGSYPYELCEIEQKRLADFFEKRDFLGINVTIPYKREVMKYLDEIDSSALAVGAVNTVVNRGGKLYGYNTDVYGMSELLRSSGVDIEGKRVIILGTGGTSRAAVAAAEGLLAESVIRVSRTAREGAIDYTTLYETGAEGAVIINTTPVGMYPSHTGCPIDLARLGTPALVADAVYNPVRTELILTAEELGIPAVGGLYMLAAQGVRASELFFDTGYPSGTAERVYGAVLAGKECITLIGMPTSGKSTVGKKLAKALGRELIDTDKLIEKTCGASAERIIRECGIDRFRELERECIAGIADTTSRVIATGGGAVLDRGNVRALKKNGRLIFIDTPKKMLTPTADRPLSSTEEDMTRLYNERHGIYLTVCDEVADGSCGADAVYERILKQYSEN